MAFLTKRQKAVLCQMAERAWRMAGQYMGFESAADYRHAIVAMATGGAAGGLTACTQQHYEPIYNALASVLGLAKIDGEAAQLKRELWMLRDALARYELTEGYARAIMADRLHMSGSEATLSLHELAERLGAEGVRQVTYTVINRGRKKTQDLAEAHDEPLPTEPHVSLVTLPPGKLAEHFNAVYIQPPRPLTIDHLPLTIDPPTPCGSIVNGR